MTGTKARAVRLLLAVLITAGSSFVFSTPSSAAPSKQQVAAAKAKLDALNEHLSLLVEEYNQARIALDQVQAKLADARAAATEARTTADRAIASLNRSAALAYQGVGSQLGALLDASSIADFSDRLEFIGSIAQADADLAGEAARAEQQAKWSADQLSQAVAERQGILDSLKQKETEIRSGVADARALYDELNKKYHDALAAKAAAAAAAAASSATDTGISPPPGGPPPAPNANAQAAIDAAYSVIGTPYVWGSANPDVGFDCSGLTMWSWAHAGVSLPHSSAMQYQVLPHVDRADIQPGDLLFFYTPIHHVGLYIGGSRMIDANHPGDVVNIRPVSWDVYVGAARP